jgi:hypothetical protein
LPAVTRREDARLVPTRGDEEAPVRAEDRGRRRPAGSKDRLSSQGAQRRSQSGFDLRGRLEAACPKRESDALLRIHSQLGIGLGSELTRMGPARLSPRVAPLDERVDSKACQNGYSSASERGERVRSALAPARGRSFGFEPLVRLVPPTPREDGLGEHVVENLVPGSATPVFVGAHDSFLDEPLEDARGFLLAD